MKNRLPSRMLAIVVLLLVVSVAGIFLWQGLDFGAESTSLEYRSLISQAKRLAAQGKATEVEKLCREAIELDAERPDAFLLAAECARLRNDPEQALQDLSHVSDRDQQKWIEATKLRADILHYDAAMFREAEQAYQQILTLEPDSVFANSGYARLLGLCGRRLDAIPFVLKLIPQSAAGDLLVLLSRQEGALTDAELIARAEKADSDDPNLWLAKANLALLNLDHEQAIELLRIALSKPNPPRLIQGRIGRELLAASRSEELVRWANDLPEIGQWVPETWLVVGQIAEQRGDSQAAIRCYWEALKRWPESLKATSRIATLLNLIGRSDDARLFQARVTSITRLRDAQRTAIMSSATPSREDLRELIDAYAECGRMAEAFAWGEAASQAFSNDPELGKQLGEWSQQISVQPLALTMPEYNIALQLDYSEFSVPTEFQSHGRDPALQQTTSVAFEKQTDAIGFRFTYFNGVLRPTRRMFEFTGGGLGVFDLDNDDWPDMVCTQGIPWPDTEPNAMVTTDLTFSDVVFRNRRGETFENLPAGLALPQEEGFGQGVAVGDFNNDGFHDLYVANAHQNQLLVNNGDGTFSSAEGYLDDRKAWTTSCLVADLNGDTLPDLYDVNYLTGEDVFSRICQQQDGQSLMCGPEAFDGAIDQVWLNMGNGQFEAAPETFLDPQPNGKGLGIVAFGQGQSSLNYFVANDTVANHFYVPESGQPGRSASVSQSDQLPRVQRLVDRAFAYGLAVNADGKSEACMGIAVADINDDQRFDLVVTNFLHESNTVYSSLTDTLFQDQTRITGLHDVSLPVLSFGTQFLDANLDGHQELFVGNGYTEDTPGDEIPYAMVPHLFEWRSDEFRQLPAESIGVWGQQEVVARSVARLDWNGDGLPDLVVGLLHDPSFLLTNRSNVRGETGLTLKLVATQSARDGIGAIATAVVDDQLQAVQLTAGDGYQCSNQRILHLSGRQESSIPEITIRWPSGAKQTFRDVPAAGHWAAIEGRPELTLISRKSD